MNRPIYQCSVCGAPGDTHIAGYRIGDVDLMLPTRFAYAYRERDKPLGLCNVCFDAGHFGDFSPAEIHHFREQFAELDATPDV